MTSSKGGANRDARRALRKAAARPPSRTVDCAIDDGPFAGWSCTARMDFPAGVLLELESGNLARIVDALGVIILEHNFPDSSDGIAATLRDVDPYDGLLVMAGQVLEAIARLPNR